MNKPQRPALRYLGGKWKLAPWIIAQFPRHDIYVEPYGGGASVLMRKPRSRAEVYNDLDEDVVNYFRVLRDYEMAAQLGRLVELTPFARGEWLEAYKVTADPLERARRLLVRSFMGFGSCASRIDRSTGWRTGMRLDSASAARDWANYAAAIPLLCERMKGVTIDCRPALEVLASYDAPGTLFYVDPPYVHSVRSKKRTRTAPSNGYAHELTDRDHSDLLGVLTGMKGAIVLSGYDTPLYAAALSDWTRLARETHADGARQRTEVLWLNPAAAGAQDLFGSGQ